MSKEPLAITNQALKHSLQLFVTCKDSTLAISEKVLYELKTEAIDHVLDEEAQCLRMGLDLSKTNDLELAPYQEAIRATNQRLLIERKFLAGLKAGDSLEKTYQTYSFSSNIIRQKEVITWNGIKHRQESPLHQYSRTDNLVSYSSWLFLGGLALLLIFKKRLEPEEIRKYFDNKTKQISDYITKLRNNRKK